jgi:hypothetical protein
MNLFAFFLFVISQNTAANPTSREIILVDSCHLSATSLLNDVKPGQQPSPLLKAEMEFSLQRHLTISPEELKIQYEDLACRSVGKENGCPQGLALSNHTVTVKLPASGTSFTVEGITWPEGWTDVERNLALRDIPLLTALASKPQIEPLTMELGLLELAPGATMKATDTGNPESVISGEFHTTGIAVPLSGSISFEGRRAIVTAKGTARQPANGMGQSTEDSVLLMCAREIRPDH